MNTGKYKKMRLNDLVPPVLVQLLKRYKNNKEYTSYDAAMQACTTEHAYHNIELCNMIADKTVIYKKELEAKPYNLNSPSVFLVSAINQYISIYSKKEIKILDFGGACGAHFFEIKRFIPPNVFLKWYVVETSQMVKSAMEKGLASDELIFVDSIEKIDTEIDIIHSSCTLHYVPDPYETINKLVKVKPNWIFFNRMMFNRNNRDFITVQKSLLSSNGPGKLPNNYTDRTITYPHNTLSFQKFNSAFSDHDFENEWVFEELSGSYQIRNEKIEGKGLLYVRK